MEETANLDLNKVYETAILLDKEYDLRCEFPNSSIYISQLGGDTLPPLDLEKFGEDMPWWTANRHQWSDVTEDFAAYFYEEIGGWDVISSWGSLSESFIDRFQDKLHWGRLSTSQNMSCDFIEKHQNRVDWSMVSINQKGLTEKFIRKFRKKLNIGHIIRFNKNGLSHGFLQDMRSYL